MALTLNFQSILVLLGTWIVWRVVKGFLYKNPLLVIDGPEPDHWLTGNLLKMMDNNSWDYLKEVTDHFGSMFRFNGFLKTPVLFNYDPKALHHVFVKDPYEPTQDFIMSNRILFGMGLFGTLGDHHRKQRKLMNPVFSIAHMREMTPIFYGVVEKLRIALIPHVANGEKEIDMLSWMNRTALELIGQSGLGYSFDTMEENAVEHPFATSIKNLPRAITDNAIMVARILFLPYVINIGSPKFQRAVVDLIPWKKLHELRDMMDTLHNTSTEIFEATKRSVKEGRESASLRIGGGKDIMSILLKANMSASEEDKLPESELLGQISSFTFAAMDTTSNALSRILQLLSENPAVQDRLREELLEAKKEHGDHFGYDILTSLPYLDAVCRESLRLYAPVPLVVRQAKKDMMLPLSKPIVTKDGKTVSEIFVPNGTQIVNSLIHCNRDEDIWGPDALEWKPERWLDPLPNTVPDSRVPGIYSHLMTFLGGGRACIGFKFSQLEMKVVLCLLIQHFKFAPSGKKIEWQLNGTIQPTIEGAEITATGNKKLQMPLRVSLA